ncbi:MAG: sigW 16 [Gemmataceae bacterium]|nr:sigW 16 [Gemmataceae bacterium]
MTTDIPLPGVPAPALDSFAAWLEASRRGSEDALGKVLEACRGYLLSVAESELGSTLRPKAGASDLVQDSLLEVRAGFDRFRGTTPGEFFAWVVVILRRNLADLARRYRTAESRAVGREEPLERMPPGILPDHTTGPADRVELAEDVGRLRAAIARLPDDARAVLGWRHEDGLGWEEIGARLGKTPEAGRKIWFRAVERLRRELGTDDDSIG